VVVYAQALTLVIVKKFKIQSFLSSNHNSLDDDF